MLGFGIKTQDGLGGVYGQETYDPGMESCPDEIQIRGGAD